MGDIIPNDNDPMLTAHYSELSHISQRIVTLGSRHVDVFSLSKSLLLQVEAKIEAFLATEIDVNTNMEIHTHDSPVSKMQKEPQLRDPTKRRSKGQSSKRIKGALEVKSRKRASSKVMGQRDNRDASHVMTRGTLNSNHTPETEIIGMTSQAYYNNNSSQWIQQAGQPSQDIFPPWNSFHNFF